MPFRVPPSLSRHHWGTRCQNPLPCDPCFAALLSEWNGITTAAAAAAWSVLCCVCGAEAHGSGSDDSSGIPACSRCSSRAGSLTRLCTQTRTRTHARTHTRTQVHTHTHTHVRKRTLHTHTHTHKQALPTPAPSCSLVPYFLPPPSASLDHRFSFRPLPLSLSLSFFLFFFHTTFATTSSSSSSTSLSLPCHQRTPSATPTPTPTCHGITECGRQVSELVLVIDSSGVESVRWAAQDTGLYRATPLASRTSQTDERCSSRSRLFPLNRPCGSCVSYGNSVPARAYSPVTVPATVTPRWSGLPACLSTFFAVGCCRCCCCCCRRRVWSFVYAAQ